MYWYCFELRYWGNYSKRVCNYNNTLQGYIKRGALSGVKQQKRGGKGKTGIKTREEDW